MEDDLVAENTRLRADIDRIRIENDRLSKSTPNEEVLADNKRLNSKIMEANFENPKKPKVSRF